MEEIRHETSCPRCGSSNLRRYPDGVFECQDCGFTNRTVREEM